MSAKITLTNAVFSATPGQNQTCTVSYRKQSDPDIPASYTVVTTNAVITTGGVFSPPVVISGLLNGIAYVVRVNNHCNNINFDKVFTTPLSSCVALLDIQGTATEE